MQRRESLEIQLAVLESEFDCAEDTSKLKVCIDCYCTEEMCLCPRTRTLWPANHAIEKLRFEVNNT